MILPYLSVKISEPVAVSRLLEENTRPLDFIAHDRKQHISMFAKLPLPPDPTRVTPGVNGLEHMQWVCFAAEEE